MKNEKHSLLAFGSLLLGASLIGLAPIFVRFSELSPSWILFYRMSLSIPMLLILNLILNNKHPLKLNSLKSYIFCAIASLAFSLDLAGWHWSIELTTISNATVMVNTAPVYVILFGVIFLNYNFSPKNLLSIIITYIGVIGLIYFSSKTGISSLVGDLISLGAGILYAVYLIIISRLGNESALKIIFYTTVFCAFYAFIFGMIESNQSWPSNTNEWLNLIMLAILCQVSGQFFITFAMPRINIAASSIGLLMQPIVATIAGAVLFFEVLTFLQICFVIIALIGIYFARMTITES